MRTRLRYISAALFAWLCLSTQARAQLALSATLESQYRVQGVSLTNGEPDARIGVSYDHPSGVYGGASAIVGDTVRNGVQPLGYLSFLGFAKRTSNGLNWDVGVINSDITVYLAPGETHGHLPQTINSEEIDGRLSHAGSSAHMQLKWRFDYTDLYAGVSGRNLSAKVYLSPDHLGQGVTTSYVDLSAAVHPVSRLRLYVHAGALTPLSGGSGTYTREHFDFGPGAAWEFRHGEVSLTWSATTPGIDYPPGVPQPRNALVLSLTGSF